VHRNLFRIELRAEPFSEADVTQVVAQVAEKFRLSLAEASELVINDTIENSLYGSDGITIRFKDGRTMDFAEASDQMNREILTRTVSKSFLCYPKEIKRSAEV